MRSQSFLVMSFLYSHLFMRDFIFLFLEGGGVEASQ